MISRLRRRMTYANVVASLCLFFVLAGGSAFAASQITGAQIASNAITSAKVKNGSLLKVDFKSGQLPKGPRGPIGPGRRAWCAGRARRQRGQRHRACLRIRRQLERHARDDRLRGRRHRAPRGQRHVLHHGPGIDPNTTPIAVTPHAKSGAFAYTIVGSGLIFSQLCTGSEFQVLTLSPADFSVAINNSSFTFVIP